MHHNYLQALLCFIISTIIWTPVKSQAPIIIPGKAWGGLETNPSFAFAVGDIWYILNGESWWTLNIEEDCPDPINNEELNQNCIDPDLMMYNSEGILLCFLPSQSSIMGFNGLKGLSYEFQINSPVSLSNVSIGVQQNDLAIIFNQTTQNSTFYVYDTVFNSIIYEMNISNAHIQSYIASSNSLAYSTVSGTSQYNFYIYQVSTGQKMLLTSFQSSQPAQLLATFLNDAVFIIDRGYYEALNLFTNVELKNFNQFIKYNDTYFLAFQGTELIFAYFTSGLSYTIVSSMSLAPFLHGTLTATVSAYQGFSTILIEISTQIEASLLEAYVVLEIDPNNMEIMKASVPQTINGKQELLYQNGTVVLLSPIGYFILATPIAFVSMQFSAFYYQASNPMYLWGYYSGQDSCYITEFSANNNEVQIYNLENCPCQSEYPLNPFLSFLAVNPYNGFPNSIVGCNRNYYAITGEIYGPFSSPSIILRPTAYINPQMSMIHLLNTFNQEGVELISFNYSQGSTAYYDKLSSASLLILPYSVKITEDMFMYGIVSPQNQLTNLYVYSLKTPTYVQNFTIATILPEMIALFVWNVSNPQPISMVAVQESVTNSFVAFDVNGEKTTFSSGGNIYAMWNGVVSTTGNAESLNWAVMFNVEEETEKGNNFFIKY